VPVFITFLLAPGSVERLLISLVEFIPGLNQGDETAPQRDNVQILFNEYLVDRACAFQWRPAIPPARKVISGGQDRMLRDDPRAAALTRRIRDG
jgi:hypothetical protein